MEMIALLLIILIAFIWHNSMQARERSLELARRTCTEMQVQLLDDTVVLTSLSFRRNPLGRLCIRRIYEFRILTLPDSIQYCTVILVGDQVESLLLDTHPYPPRVSRLPW